MGAVDLGNGSSVEFGTFAVDQVLRDLVGELNGVALAPTLRLRQGVVTAASA